MLYGVKIAISKDEVAESGEALWQIVESYDSLLRRYKINMITWSIIDLDQFFIVAAMIPGDYYPELSIAKMALNDGVEKIASGNLSLENVRPEDFLQMKCGTIVRLLVSFVDPAITPYGLPSSRAVYGEVGKVTRIIEHHFFDIKLESGITLERVWEGSVAELSPLEQLARVADNGI